MSGCGCGRLGVDVVGVDRIAAMAGRDLPTLRTRLLDPAMLAGSGCSDPDDLAFVLTAKEAWVKSVGRRPPGWTFDQSVMVDVGLDDLPAAAARLARRFSSDLGVTDLRCGRLEHPIELAGGEVGAGWAIGGRFDRWMISVVSS